MECKWEAKPCGDLPNRSVCVESGDAFGIGKFDRVVARAGNVLVAEYREGVCPNSSSEARVNLVIICKIGVTDSSPVYVGMLEECFYEFQWEHTAACPTSNHITYGQDCKVQTADYVSCI